MENFTYGVLVCSWVLFFVSAYLFIHYYLLRDYEVKNIPVQVIFSTTFALSGALLELVLLELGAVEVNLKVWNAVFFSYCVLMLYLTPFYIIFYLFYRFRFKWALIALSYGVFLWSLNYNWKLVGIYFGEASESLHFSMVEQVKLLGVNGVIISSGLSGFGAVNCAYNYFNFFCEATSQKDLKELSQLSKSNIQQIVDTKRKMLLLPIQNNQTYKEKVLSFFKTNSLEEKAQRLSSKLHGLEAIHQQYMLNISEIIDHRQKERYSKTFKGKFFSLLARILVFIGIYKVLLSSYNFFMRKKYTLDPITRAFQVFCYVLDAEFLYSNFLANQVSFIFVGVLIFSNIRGFANLMTNIVRSCGKLLSSGLSSEALILMFSEVMGAYFIATVILMRANLPEVYRQGITNALNGIDFFTFHHIFDATFCISSIAAATLLYCKYFFRIKRKTN